MRTTVGKEIEANRALRLLTDKRSSPGASSPAEHQCPGGRMLVDVGCGSGDFARRVHERYDTVVGMDFIPLARSDSDNVHLVRADLRQGIPLGDEVADTVTAIEVVEHITNPVLLAREAFRIARPGGKFILTTPNVRYVRHLFHLVVQGQGPKTSGHRNNDLLWDGGHIHYFTSNDLVRLLKEAGFASVGSTALIQRGGFLPMVRRLLLCWPGNPLVREFLTGRLLVIGTKPWGAPV